MELVEHDNIDPLPELIRKKPSCSIPSVIIAAVFLSQQPLQIELDSLPFSPTASPNSDATRRAARRAAMRRGSSTHDSPLLSQACRHTGRSFTAPVVIPV